MNSNLGELHRKLITYASDKWVTLKAQNLEYLKIYSRVGFGLATNVE
jgi:hypothetical protein